MAKDIPSIRSVIQAAFGRPHEADLVEALRSAGALTLSVVVEVRGRIVGHVAFSPVEIGGKYAALALAPVAVAPEYQRQGIGTALIRWSFEECQRLGHRIIIVLGNPNFYRRFGFTTASGFGIECPFSVSAENFMVAELSPGAAAECRGAVRYRPEFGLIRSTR